MYEHQVRDFIDNFKRYPAVWDAGLPVIPTSYFTAFYHHIAEPCTIYFDYLTTISELQYVLALLNFNKKEK